MGSTWVLPAPDGPHVGPMNPAIRDANRWCDTYGTIVEVGALHDYLIRSTSGDETGGLLGGGYPSPTHTSPHTIMHRKYKFACPVFTPVCCSLKCWLYSLEQSCRLGTQTRLCFLWPQQKHSGSGVHDGEQFCTDWDWVNRHQETPHLYYLSPTQWWIQFVFRNMRQPWWRHDKETLAIFLKGIH